jgi:hypothetical protein
MKKLFFALVVLGVAMTLPTALEANGSPCSLEGTWYGSNTLGGDYVMTIARTGARSYSALLVSGSGPAHGEFVRKGHPFFKTTWMGYADGFDFGFPEGTKVMYYMHGEGHMVGCDTWTATTDWDVYLFNPGVEEDPFQDGVYQYTIPGVVLTYRQMPMTFPAP